MPAKNSKLSENDKKILSMKLKHFYFTHPERRKQISEEQKERNRLNPVTHLNTPENRKKAYDKLSELGFPNKPWSIFGEKFVNHYNIRPKDDLKLYYKEHKYFRKYGKCSWE